MSETRFAARIVRVDIEERHPGLFFATSADLKGLFVAKESMNDLREAVPHSISALYEACGQPVIVEHLEADDRTPDTWVTMPAVAAQAALDRLKKGAAS